MAKKTGKAAGKTTKAASKSKPEPKPKSKVEPPKKRSPLEIGLEGIDKLLKNKGSIVDMSNRGECRAHIPTGSIVFDFLIGGEVGPNGINICPGVPRGGLTNVFGEEHSGKTTFALTVASQICAMGGTCLFLDFEHAVEPHYAEALGVPIEDQSRFALQQPATLEDGVRSLVRMIRCGVDLVVLDSTGAARPEAVFKQSHEKLETLGEKAVVGLAARKWSELLPFIIRELSVHNTAMIALSQMRSTIPKPGSYGPSESVTGGNAWKYFSTVRIYLKRCGSWSLSRVDPFTGKIQDVEVGAKVRATVRKCRISGTTGYRQQFYIEKGRGIDDLRSVIDIATAHGIINKNSSWFEWTTPEGKHVRVQGEDAFREAIRDSQDAYRVLYQQVVPLLSYRTKGGSGDPQPTDDDLEALLQG